MGQLGQKSVKFRMQSWVVRGKYSIQELSF